MFVLEIEWDAPGMPRLVGPFDRQAEAEDWAALNVLNGSWQVCPVAHPYRKAQR